MRAVKQTRSNSHDRFGLVIAGIRDRAKAQALVAAGASRIGASAGLDLVKLVKLTPASAPAASAGGNSY